MMMKLRFFFPSWTIIFIGPLDFIYGPLHYLYMGLFGLFELKYTEATIIILPPFKKIIILPISYNCYINKKILLLTCRVIFRRSRLFD